MRRRFIFGLLVSALVATSCSSSNDASTDTTTPPSSTADTPSDASPFTPFVGGEIRWTECDGVQCGTLEVPFDYEDPTRGSFTLHVSKRPASNKEKRIGALLVNPGGPGFGGASLARDAEFYFTEDITDVFDVVGWDPRGTGETTPAIDCIDDYDNYFAYDPSPDNDAEQKEMEDSGRLFVEKCVENNKEILPYISTVSSARDMDRIRAALGENTISYFGFSYGSELGATWATMFPTTVRAAVIDGATNPNLDYTEEGLQQAMGFERQLTAFLADCSARKSCEFHNNGNAEAAFDALLAQLDLAPLVVTSTRPAVNQGVALIAASYAMYSQSSWETLAIALADAQKSDGAGLLDLYDSYYQRLPDGTFGNELEAFYAISCLDDPGPKSVAEADALRPEFLQIAPRLGDSFAAGYVCVFWPTYDTVSIPITGKGAGPIVVVGTTGDSATPIESTRAMADALEDGHLVTVTAERHTGYGANNCVIEAVDTFLIEQKVPEPNLVC